MILICVVLLALTSGVGRLRAQDMFGGGIFPGSNPGFSQWNNDPYADPALSTGGFHPMGHSGGFSMGSISTFGSSGMMGQMGGGSCGSSFFLNPMTHICCQGFAVPRCAGAQSHCCAGKCFNPQTQLCCAVEVVGRCGPQSTCCGTHCFNPTTQICCGGHVAGRCGPSSFCCGRVCFNPQIQMCCSGTPVGRCGGAFSGCCGRVCYDRRHVRCCPGNIVKKYCDFGPFGGGQYSGDIFGSSINPGAFNSPGMQNGHPFGFNPSFMG